MSKKAFIIHGWDGSPNEPMHLWIKQELEQKGYSVTAPEMPNPETPEINAWVSKISEVCQNPNEETLFIGHSVGCQTILRYLQTLSEEKVGKVILIAPWMHLDESTIEEEGPEVEEIARPWMETPIGWEKIKTHCDNFICIFSDDDPFVPLSDEQLFQENLNAKTTMLHKKGHFTGEGGVKELPEILQFID